MATTAITPDTKDWTWVLDRACPDCGFVAGDVEREQLRELILANAGQWARVLATPHATTRPRPGVWSVTEYACHVRDVHGVFAERLHLMLTQDTPRFENWDQDATAVEQGYDRAEPAAVAAALLDSAEQVARVYDGITDADWRRSGLRSDGSAFSVETLGRYHLHDIVHHVWDVRAAVTVASYDDSATDYSRATQPVPPARAQALDEFVASVGTGARVLEIGSGAGRDAGLLEDAGLSVRRTDVTPAFVALMRADGQDADLVDPLFDDLADPRRPGTPYDAVWASACLLHVAREDLPVVLHRLAGVTRPEGVLRLSVKEGDGEDWSTHGSVTEPRMFVYWREAQLRAAVEAAGWEVADVEHAEGLRGESWLGLVARRTQELP